MWLMFLAVVSVLLFVGVLIGVSKTSSKNANCIRVTHAHIWG